ncbi:lipopolysaccharide-induced tumor necrosis factor-alpha factor [Vespula squamosa]|uniref:Lipopolysaccharide-induced tumor necrosis factor-alpha factor n=1 Tax=Vespula squamosa TaxID=30214 RepID=A0ABD1ZX39_VESSQ
MEENEIPSTSRRHILHVSSNSLIRQRMSFYADVPSIDTYEEKKRGISYTKFVKKLLNDPRQTRHNKQIKRKHTHFEKHSEKTTCPNCLNYIETDVKHYNTCTTHLIAILLIPVCMCFLPYYSVTFKDTVHSCPKCEIYLGTKFSKSKNFLQRLKTKKSTNNNL